MKNLIKLIISFTVLVHGFGCTSAFAQFNAVQEQAIDKNYLANGGFENGLAGPWRTYKDAAQAAPVDGTGGTAGITIAQSTTSPIQGKTSVVLTKGASNLQGEGFAVPFVIDKEARGKVLSISGSYEIVSGTYSGGTQTTDSDVEVYIYDVDTGTVIQPAGYKLDGGVTGYTYSINATFQPINLNSVNYRLILHVATTSANAYSMRLDTFKVSTQKKSQGPPLTDWQELSGFTYANVTPGTGGTQQLWWRRIGDGVQLRGKVVLGTGGSMAGVVSMTLPFGWSVDTAKIGTTSRLIIGNLYLNDASPSLTVSGNVQFTNASNTQLFFYSNGTNTGANPVSVVASNAVNATSPWTWAVNDTFEFVVDFPIPIVGMSSSVTMSDSADTRVVSARYTLSGTQSIPDASLTTIIWNSRSYDTHGAMNTSTGAYVAPVPGYYRIKAAYGNTASLPIVSGNRIGVYYQINGGNNVIMSYIPYGSTFSEQPIVWGDDTAYMNAGDSLVIKAFMDYGGGPYTIQSSNGGQTYVTIERVSGPSQIAASELVAARYTTTAGQTYSTAPSPADLIYGTKVFDTHGAYNSATGIFTCPVAGTYSVSAQYSSASTLNLTTSQAAWIYIVKNGSAQSQNSVNGNGNNNNWVPRIHDLVQCVAGDQIKIQLSISVNSSVNTSGVYNYVAINRVGN